MFRAIISPLLRSARLCLYSVWYNAPMILPAGDQDEVESFRFHLVLVTNVTGRELVPVPVQSRSRKVAVTVVLMPNAVDTVTWAPDDGWRYHPQYVERFTDINKLYVVVSCWKIIGIHFTMHGPMNVRLQIRNLGPKSVNNHRCQTDRQRHCPHTVINPFAMQIIVVARTKYFQQTYLKITQNK